MTAIFVEPLPFVAAPTGSSATLAGTSIANLSNDIAGLVWRAASATSSVIVIDLGVDPVAYDTIALIGSNFTDVGVVRWACGPTVAATAYNVLTEAYLGSKPKNYSTKSIHKLPTVRTDRYVKITVMNSANPDGIVQFQRLVVGKSVQTLGIKFGAKMTFEDRSLINISPGFTQIDRYDVLPAWEVQTSGVTDQKWRTEWAPLLMYAGASRGILFVRDITKPDLFQTDAVFGRITNKASGEAASYDSWVLNATILSFAP